MQRILLTEPIRSKEGFYAALGRVRGCANATPRNLDALADFLRENHLKVIVAADLLLEPADYAAIGLVLRDLSIRLVR